MDKESTEPPVNNKIEEDEKRKFKLPSWAIAPENALDKEERTKLFLKVYKNDDVIESAPIGNKVSYVFGRNPNCCDLQLDHTSISREHAALVHHPDGVYIIDLDSAHGTFLDNKQLKPNKPMKVNLFSKLRFGASSRIYELSSGLTEKTAGSKRVREVVHNNDETDSKKSKSSTVRCSHILVKHNKSRRPSSWKQDNITRSKEEAIVILKGYQARLLVAEDLRTEFEKIATTESDCSSAKHGGDLGPFGPGQMQKPFEDASFALQVGEMSNIVETDSGVHLIYRIE